MKQQIVTEIGSSDSQGTQWAREGWEINARFWFQNGVKTGEDTDLLCAQRNASRQEAGAACIFTQIQIAFRDLLARRTRVYVFRSGAA